GMNAHSADLPDVAQADEAPRLTAIDGAIHPAADRHVAANVVRAGTDVHHRRIRWRHLDRADRRDWNLPIRDREPRATRIRCLPHPARRDAHVERRGLARHTGYRGDAAAAIGTDHAISAAL